MNCTIVDGTEKMELSEVMDLLKQTYWAAERSSEIVRRSMENSRCFGIRQEEEKKLVGFARVISDLATTYYLCDVVVDSRYQRMGLGKRLISYIENLPEYRGLRGVLITRDAHAFYEKFGFEPLDGRAMVKGLNC